MQQHEHDEFDEIEDQYYERLQRQAQSHPSADAMVPAAVQQMQIPLYDISLAQMPEATPQDPFLTRRYGGIPTWGWGLIGIGTLAGGYFLYKHGSLTPNDGESHEPPPAPALPEDTKQSKWEPSRGAFGKQLTKWISKRGLPAKEITLYTDADDAQKAQLKHVSPLVTMKCSTSVQMPLADLEKFCAREGLTATDHGDGAIGFYPAENGRRAKEWEEYIDALRDAGQKA